MKKLFFVAIFILFTNFLLAQQKVDTTAKEVRYAITVKKNSQIKLLGDIKAWPDNPKKIYYSVSVPIADRSKTMWMTMKQLEFYNEELEERDIQLVFTILNYVVGYSKIGYWGHTL